MALSSIVFGFIAVLIALPCLAVVGVGILSFDSQLWQHLIDHLLPRYLQTTTWLLFFVVGLSSLWGACCAWLIAAYDFCGRRFWMWALVLPFTVPSYLAAYAYVDFLQQTGPVFDWLRQNQAEIAEALQTSNIRSFPVAVVVMSAGLFPYIYIACLTSLRRQSPHLFEAARSLGMGEMRTFVRVSLPLMWPALSGGALLVALEVLNDFGTVDHFALDTMATGLYRLWFGYGERDVAAQFGAVFLGLVALIMLAEFWVRRRARFWSARNPSSGPQRLRLNSWAAVVAWSFCAIPFALGFVGPVLILVRYASLSDVGHELSRIAPYIGRSFLIAASVGLVCVLVALIAALRTDERGAIVPSRSFARLSSLGYAIPGGLIAVGIMSIFPMTIPMIWLLGYGLVVRFMALPTQILDAAKAGISPNLGMAARTLGAGASLVLWRVHLPLIAPPALGAGLLVFVDTVKELSLSVVLRPFNFELLPIRIHNLASDERLDSAAIGALVLIAISIPAVLWFHRGLARSARL